MYSYKLMAPGPVALMPEVRKILAEEMIHHRSPMFKADLQTCVELLPQIFATRGKVLMSSSTGSGAMEAAITNFVAAGEKVCVVNSGKFGERWLEMAYLHGLEVIEINVKWGESVDLEQVKQVFSQHKDIKAFYSQYCETSTGALHPVKDIAKYIKQEFPDCLVAIDAITAVLTTELKMEEWGIDICVAGSQKAFMLPTGLSFIALSEMAENRILKTSASYYFNLNKEIKSLTSNQTAFSSNVPLVKALSWTLKHITHMGIDDFINDLNQRTQLTRKYLDFMQLEIYPVNPAPALTAFCVPQNMDGSKLREHLEVKYNITFMGGQDHLKGKIIRIGHMGHISLAEVHDAMKRLALALNDFGLSIDMEKLKSIGPDS